MPPGGNAIGTSLPPQSLTPQPHHMMMMMGGHQQHHQINQVNICKRIF
jgi:hypothetical protein